MTKQLIDELRKANELGEFTPTADEWRLIYSAAEIIISLCEFNKQE